MNDDHKTRYLLESPTQTAYEHFSKVDDPERLEAELALARAICQQAVNAQQLGLAGNLLQVIAKLSGTVTEQRVRSAELLEKAAALRAPAGTATEKL